MDRPAPNIEVDLAHRSKGAKLLAELPRRETYIAGGHHFPFHPPSMEIAVPVIERAMSPQTYAASSAISSGCTNCRVGCGASMTLRITSASLMPCTLA